MNAANAPMFPKLTAYQIQCAIDAGEKLDLKDGDVIFREGVGRADFYVILEGKIKVVRETPGGQTVLVVHEPGEFTGTTDLLTGENATATGYALGPTRVARVRAEKFNELILSCPEMRGLLLPALTSRRTTEYAIETQQQKLAALGKMSAGLAHELNNPAAAAGRSAHTLTCSLTAIEDIVCDLLNTVITPGREEGIPLTTLCEMARRTPEEIDPLTRNEREDELCEWLGNLGLKQPWEAAGSLVGAGVSRKELEPLLERSGPKLALKLIAWLANDIDMRVGCRDLAESTKRMSEIVKAMKEYSHMDQAGAKSPTDLNKSLDTTMTVLKHRVRPKNISVRKEYGTLPLVSAFGGALNQVWTNLLNNAIDAAPPDGHLVIRTSVEGNDALVEITDDGPGIPPEIRARIFEPFFTTKGVGEGTGLGLDISHRIIRDHGGSIRFDSVPGRTTFSVRLPIH